MKKIGGRVQTLPLIVMPEPWFQCIKSEGKNGDVSGKYEAAVKLINDNDWFSKTKFCILNGNHRREVFVKQKYKLAQCYVISPFTKSNLWLTPDGLTMLQAGQNFIQSNGTLLITWLEQLIRLEDLRSRAITGEKKFNTGELGNVCYI